MQIGCHGLVWSGTIDPEGFEYSVTQSIDAGFDLLEIPLLDTSRFGVEAAKTILSQRPIAVAASLAQDDDTDISSDDPQKVAAGEVKIFHAIDILAELGATYLVGALYGELKKHMLPASPEGRANSIAVLQRAADYAAERGMTLGLEVVNRYETNLFNTAKGALAYIDEIDRPNVGIHLDTYHMNIEESDMVEPVLACGDRLVYVHVGESHRGYLGSGTVDFDGFFKALNHINYTGPITFESFSTTIVDQKLSRMLAIWRNLWDDSADLGAQANAFIRSHVRAAETIAFH